MPGAAGEDRDEELAAAPVVAEADGEPDAECGMPGARDPAWPGAEGDATAGLAATVGAWAGLAVAPLGTRSSTGARPGRVEQAVTSTASATATMEGRTQW